MAFSLSILIAIFAWITPVDEWKEIQKGNIAMAMILSSVIIGTALVIGLTLMS